MNICIYGASSNELDKKYLLSAEELGKKIAVRGHGLVSVSYTHLTLPTILLV